MALFKWMDGWMVRPGLARPTAPLPFQPFSSLVMGWVGSRAILLLERNHRASTGFFAMPHFVLTWAPALDSFTEPPAAERELTSWLGRGIVIPKCCSTKRWWSIKWRKNSSERQGLNWITRQILLYLALQRNFYCKLHYEANPIVICITNGILL